MILCCERRYPNHNSVIRLKSSILAPQIFWSPPNFWGGYAAGAWSSDRSGGGRAPSQGNVNTFHGGTSSHALCNMDSLINKLTNKYICLYNLFIVMGAWNKGQLLKGSMVEKRLRTTGLLCLWRRLLGLLFSPWNHCFRFWTLVHRSSSLWWSTPVPTNIIQQ